MKVHSTTTFVSYWTTTLLFSSLLLQLLLLLQLPNLSLACKCEPPSLNVSLFENPNAIVIAGRIINKIKLVTSMTTPMDETMDRLFAFRVRQVYKACPGTIQPEDIILVSTRSSTAACGLDLQPYTGYIFTALQETMPAAPEDNNNPLSSVFQVSVASCDYNAELPIAAELKQTLRQFRNNTTQNAQYMNCEDSDTTPPTLPPTPTPTPPPPKPCTTGADCNQYSEYCDAVNNACVTIIDNAAECPTPPGHYDCWVAPCEATAPCQDAPGPLTCIDYICGECTAIFLDANRTQVCN